MSRPNKAKLPTQAPSSALFQPFSGLDLGGLPPGPASEEGKNTPERPVVKKGRAVLRRETAHRGGKTVVVVDGFDDALPAAVIETLAKKLRTTCGCGGSVKNRSIEIQGEQTGRIREILIAEGFHVAGER